MCTTPYDLNQAKGFLNEDCLSGFEDLPEEHKAVVTKSFEKGNPVEPPAPVTTAKKAPKKPKTSKKKRTFDEEHDTLSDEEYSESPAPKKKRARSAKPAPTFAIQQNEAEVYAEPTSKPVELNPEMARIQALVDKMRAESAESHKNKH
jgi:hypothetical protein